MLQLLGSIINKWLVYDTVRYTRIKHTGLALSFYGGCLAISAYIIIWELVLNGGHFHRQNVQGFTKFSISSPGVRECDVHYCDGHKFTSDEHLPYCERYIGPKDGKEIPGPKVKQQLPCAMFDARDADVGNQDDSTSFVPTRIAMFTQYIGCPEKLTHESGFRVNHSSYYCKRGWWSNKQEPDWDGYMIEPNKFRLVILHGFDPSMPEKFKMGGFFTNMMQGFYADCRSEGDDGKEICERKIIPCVHRDCGMTDEDKRKIMASYPRTTAKGGSSFSQETEDTSDRQEEFGAARQYKSRSIGKSHLKLGFQSHLGFLEYIAPDIQGSSSSRYALGSNSQNDDMSGNPPHSSVIDPNNILDVRDGWYRETWRRVFHNLERDMDLDLDEGIYQGKHGLVTSIGFLMRIAGISSLDQEVKYQGLKDRNFSETFSPRDFGIHLKINFDYTNIPRNGMELYASKTPTYTMKVLRAKPSVYMTRKRIPADYTFDETTRKQSHIFGIQVTSSHSGELVSFDLGQLLIVCTSGLGLLAALLFALDFISTYLSPFSKQFEKHKFIECCIKPQSSGGDASHESDKDNTMDVASVEDGVKHTMSVMKAMEERLQEMEAKDRERGATDAAREARLKEMEAKDCAKEEMLKEMAAKIARLEASSNEGPKRRGP